jgi:hypothetical protein
MGSSAAARQKRHRERERDRRIVVPVEINDVKRPNSSA